MHALSCKGIEVGRKSSNKRFSFTCSHFSNFPIVQHHPTDQLHIIWDHIPSDMSACSHPFIFPFGLIIIDGDVRFMCGKIPVVLCSCCHEGVIVDKPATCFLYDCKSFG